MGQYQNKTVNEVEKQDKRTDFTFFIEGREPRRQINHEIKVINMHIRVFSSNPVYTYRCISSLVHYGKNYIGLANNITDEGKPCTFLLDPEGADGPFGFFLYIDETDVTSFWRTFRLPQMTNLLHIVSCHDNETSLTQTIKELEKYIEDHEIVCTKAFTQLPIYFFIHTLGPKSLISKIKFNTNRLYNTYHHYQLIFFISVLFPEVKDIQLYISKLYFSFFPTRMDFFIKYKDMIQIVRYVTPPYGEKDDIDSFACAVEKLLTEAKYDKLIQPVKNQ